MPGLLSIDQELVVGKIEQRSKKSGDNEFMPKILAIDDKKDDLTTVSALLNDILPDCVVLTAESGEAGIRRAIKDQPDTILLDIEMPGLDGFEVCRRLKADDSTRHIPVILLATEHIDTDSKFKGLDIGADAFLIKPIDAAELIAQVKVMLRIKKAEDEFHKERVHLDHLVSIKAKELWEHEFFFSQMFEQSTTSTCIYDSRGTLIRANPEFCRMFGVDSEVVTDGRYNVFQDQAVIDAGVVPFLKEIFDKRKRKRGEINFDVDTASVSTGTPTTKKGRIYLDIHGYPVMDTKIEIKYVVLQHYDITKRKQVEESLRRRTNDLNERVKELNCLYGISELVEDSDFSLDELLVEIVNLVPLSWQYPEITCSRIIVNSQEFRSENFRKTIWKQDDDINVHGNKQGILEVYYLEERSEIDEGPFMSEERHLINAISERLGKILERHQIKDALIKSEKKFQAAFESAKDCIIIWDRDYNYIYANQSAIDHVGTTRDKVIGKNIRDGLGHLPDFMHLWMNRIDRVFENGEVASFQDKTMMQGHYLFSDSIITPIRNPDESIEAVCVVYRDITELADVGEQIKNNLEEKEVLLKEKEVLLEEIHHRVKNNMQVVSSLLGLQIGSIDDKKTQEALQDSQFRIQAMSFIHQTLYDSDNLSMINIKAYLLRLLGMLSESIIIDPSKVKINVEVEEINLSVEQATPMGLIVSELVSNSMKYAFPDDGEGEITIKLQTDDQLGIELAVFDNGVGMRKDFSLHNTDSLGLGLVQILAERQLDGTIELKPDHGTCFIIRFKPK